MKKYLILLVIPLLFSCSEPRTPLRFNENGEFKIVQFTDIHFNCNSQASTIALKRIDEVLAAENPDLVVITGDIVYSSPAEDAMRAVLDRVAAHDVPFCITFGNHDGDFGTDKGELYDIACSYPQSVMPPRNGVESPDYAIELTGAAGEGIAGVIYCFDSNAHLFNNAGEFTGYDWIHGDQVEWYNRTSAAYTAANGGAAVPSTAFFHIPLPEYSTAVVEGGAMVGTRREAVCAPYFNSGLFDAIKGNDDVFACFVGHDHDNDYAVMWQDVLLAYGRFTGGNTEYNNLSNGARVIVLKEGKKELETHVRLKGGATKDKVAFPSDFVSTDWRSRPLDPECLGR